MTCNKKRIMITGARALCALDLARNLHAAGHEIIAADTTSIHPIRFSNAISGFHVTPSPRFFEEEFISTILSLAKTHQIDLIIPLWEEGIYISKHLHLFSSICEVFCSSFDTLLTLHNKWMFIQKLQELNFSVPKTVLIRSAKDLKELTFRDPYILKACYSRGPRKVSIITPPEQPTLDFVSANPYVAQEYVSGSHHCSYSICHQGKVLAHSVYPVKYTIDGSSCILFQAIEHKKNYEWVCRLIKELNYTGQISLDFIEKPNGDLYAIECNPRSTSGLHLFSHSDHIDKAFFNQTGETIFARKGYSRQLAWGMLIYGLRQGFAEGRFKEYLKMLVNTKDVVFDFQDIKPSLAQPIVLAAYLWSSWKTGIPMARNFNYDLEWNEHPSQQNEKLAKERTRQQCRCVK